MTDRNDEPGTLSLAELGDHVGALRKLHRDAVSDEADVPELSFSEIRGRCAAILALLDRAEGRAADVDPEDPEVKRGRLAANDTLGSDRLSMDEAALRDSPGETKAESRRAVARLFGSTDDSTVEAIIGKSHIRNPELKSRKK